MKIGLLVPSWPPGSAANGIATYSSHLVPALRDLGHEVYLLAFRVDEPDEYTTDLRSFDRSPSLLQRAVARLAPETALFNKVSSMVGRGIEDLAARHHLDVLEMEESFGWSLAASGRKLLPVVVRLHGPWFLNGNFNSSGHKGPEHFRRLKREGKSIAKADYVTAPSAAVLQAAKLYYNLTLPASTVIGNPINAAPRTDIWNANTCDRNTILFVGRFDARKGAELVLRAVAEITAIRPEIRLIFVGPDDGIKGPDGHRWSFDQYIQKSFPEAFRSNVNFFGKISHSEVMSLRTKCFVTVVASQYEIAPYSILEAMSLGCPIVATDVGGIPELIRNGQNGLLAPCNNVKAMTTAINHLLDDHAFSAQIGQQAWLDCRNFYLPENVAQQTVRAHHLAIDIFKKKR
jgi:glycosyltransferase involved in cell wall biosynthesis